VISNYGLLSRHLFLIKRLRLCVSIVTHSTCVLQGIHKPACCGVSFFDTCRPCVELKATLHGVAHYAQTVVGGLTTSQTCQEPQAMSQEPIALLIGTPQAHAYCVGTGPQTSSTAESWHSQHHIQTDQH
jgi:hypothetical protein